MNLYPQVIEKGGKGAFVVLPIEEYQALYRGNGGFKRCKGI